MKKKRRKRRFTIPKRNSGEKVNWKDLKPGDKIKLLKGYGPYYPLTTDNGIENIPIGYTGIFIVCHLYENGILTYAIKSPDTGFCFIHMSDGISKSGIVKQPHKIRLLSRKEETDLMVWDNIDNANISSISRFC